jgi:hypothetical protein
MRALALLTLTLTTISLSAAPVQNTRPGTATKSAQKPAPKTTPPRRAAPPAAPKREAAVPFVVGETLTYDVSWSGLLTAGTATTRVIEKRDSFGSTAYAVVAEGRPLPLIARLYPVYYKMDSLLDSYTLLSQWSALYREERGKKRNASTLFDRTARKANYEITNEPASKLSLTVPADIQDGLALLFALRARTFKSGERVSFPVADDGQLYTVEFATSGPEVLRVPIGERDAWNVGIRIVDADRQPVGDNIGIWFSTDPKHLPLRIKADLPVGSFLLSLKDAR